jgi:steroid 5-alpha reductase family enzyme
MADIDERTGNRAGMRGDTGTRTRPSVKMVTSTETRRAFMTTELWIAVAMAAAVIVAAYINDSNQIGLDQAWALGAGVVAAYVLSRGFAKAGSRDPQMRDVD